MTWKLTLLSALTLSATAFATASPSHDDGGDPPTPPPANSPRTDKPADIIDLSNENCPVMGGKAEADVYIDYEGVRVHFCCPGCDRRFLKDPDKYLKVLGIDDLSKFKNDRRKAR
ncbi:MAG: YHS domain-containing protein [Myxococcales bacterium]|nr:YHS domain-containing protein [Myxococcales bacterium]